VIVKLRCACVTAHAPSPDSSEDTRLPSPDRRRGEVDASAGHSEAEGDQRAPLYSLNVHVVFYFLLFHYCQL